jgi:type II secretory pathway pseudopilin PulG
MVNKEVKMRRLDLGREGMTILEVLIAAGIMSVLAMAFATMFANAFKREAQLEHKQASREYRDEIDYALAGENCGLPAASFSPSATITVNPTVTTETPIFQTPGDCTKTLTSVGKIIGCNTAVGPLTIIRAAIGPMTYASALTTGTVTTGSYSAVVAATATNPGYYYGEIRVHFLMPAGAQNPATPATPVITVSRHPVLLKINSSNGLVGCRTIRDVAYSRKSCEETRIDGAVPIWIDTTNYIVGEEDSLFTCNLESVDPDPSETTTCLFPDGCGTTPTSTSN